jgi:CspA family cold shock protein
VLQGKEIVMPDGKVKWFNNAKGYGFITTEDGTDAFVHYKDIGGEGFKSLVEGEDVVFELAEGPKGPKALNVVKKEEVAEA